MRRDGEILIDSESARQLLEAAMSPDREELDPGEARQRLGRSAAQAAVRLELTRTERAILDYHAVQARLAIDTAREAAAKSLQDLELGS